MADVYSVVEIMATLQGEGVKAGVPMVFCRFAGCNLACSGEVVDQAYQPMCDAYFASGRKLTLDELVAWVKQEAGKIKWVCLTGGEPMLQVDDALIDRLHAEGFQLAIETNGTHEVPKSIDWITVSPKVAEHALRQKTADEVKYVIHHGMPCPKSSIDASFYLLSPHFEGMLPDPRSLAWAVKLAKENPSWRLSCQTHKWVGIR